MWTSPIAGGKCSAPPRRDRPGRIGFCSTHSLNSGAALKVAATRSSSPSKRKMKALPAPHSLAELSATVLNTASRSNAERLMTSRTSAVAVWRSNDSRSSLSSRGRRARLFGTRSASPETRVVFLIEGGKDRRRFGHLTWRPIVDRQNVMTVGVLAMMIYTPKNMDMVREALSYIMRWASPTMV